MKLVLLGPPGIGKGTQAKIICKRFTIPHLSTGDMLRSAITAKSDLGKKARTFMDRGNLVPDEVVLGMVEERLQKPDVHGGYLFDGFPRTLTQADGLNELLNRINQNLDIVVALEGDDDILIKRLSSRRTCESCGTITNLIFSPPREEGKCDECSGELIQRDDDKPDVISERLKVYQRQTEPLIAYYAEKDQLIRVNGVGTIKDITARISKNLPDGES
jgi:adenylate kinase